MDPHKTVQIGEVNSKKVKVLHALVFSYFDMKLLIKIVMPLTFKSHPDVTKSTHLQAKCPITCLKYLRASTKIKTKDFSKQAGDEF